MNSVELFVYDYPDEKQREIIVYLHELIMTYPNVHSKMRFKIPFYDHYSWFCYINPRKNKQVDLSFINANKFSQNLPWLESRDRVQVKSISYKSLSDINEEELIISIDEALETDKRLKELKSRK